jgi:hypothetical protein
VWVIGIAGRREVKIARHAQVHDEQHALAKLDQNVLGSPGNAGDPPARQTRAQLAGAGVPGRAGPEKLGTGCEAAASQPLMKLVDHNLHFR